MTADCFDSTNSIKNNEPFKDRLGWEVRLFSC